MLFLSISPQCVLDLLTPARASFHGHLMSQTPHIQGGVSSAVTAQLHVWGVWGNLSLSQPHWVETLRDASPLAPSHALSSGFHFLFFLQRHHWASLPSSTPSLESVGKGGLGPWRGSKAER